jgi:hypothetical protein
MVTPPTRYMWQGGEESISLVRRCGFERAPCSAQARRGALVSGVPVRSYDVYYLAPVVRLRN